MFGHVNCIDSLRYIFLATVYMVFPSKVFINMNTDTFSSLYSFEMFIINMQKHTIGQNISILGKKRMYLVFDGLTES